MKKLNQLKGVILLIGITFLLQSCSLLGIHFKVHNPKNPGKLPKFDQEAILLGELTKYRTCFDVYYYDLSVNVDPEEKYLKGEVAVFATATTDFDTLQIDLDDNLKVNSVTSEKGEALPYYRKERAIFIHFPQDKNTNFSLTVNYEGEPTKAKKPPWQGGFTWDEDKDGYPYIGVSCESEGASVWWPLKDHTADEPDSMRLHYTIPRGLVAVGNGQLEGIDKTEKEETYNWFISYPINTYNVTIYVGNFKLLKDTYHGIDGDSLFMSHYVLRYNYNRAKKHFQQLHPQLRLFEERFGKYPWYRDGFKLVESPYAGMEHQTAIAYGNGYKNNGAADYIILHETAHEWWGNSITARDLAHVWLQEGFATYAEALYHEKRGGKSSYNSEISTFKIFIKNKYPLVGIEGRRWFHFRKGSDAYMKGALVLHTLRRQIDNDSLFFDVLKSFAVNYKAKIIDSKDFMNWVNQRTGKNYDWFFNHYLYNNEAPSLSCIIDDTGKLFYKWNNTKEDFNQLNLTVWNGKNQITITPSTQLQSVQLEMVIKDKYEFYFPDNLLFEEKKDKKLLK